MISELRNRAPIRAKQITGGLVIAVLTLLTQVILRRHLTPGEFGTMNGLFGVALVLLLPLAAFSAFLHRALAEAHMEKLHVPLLNRAAIAWAVACVAILLAALPWLKLPRASIQFFTLLVVMTGLLAICGRPATPARWCAVIGVSAAVLRLLVSAWAGGNWPSAESGLGALLLAGLLAGLPALRDQPGSPSIVGAWKILRPEFVPGLAAVSVGLALGLFGNADRIAAQPAFTAPNSVADGFFIDYARFDEYQSAGLLARGVLWGLFPLLIPFYLQRRAMTRTTNASLRWFWIYLGALFVASVALAFCGPLESALFGGPSDVFLPGFAGAILLLGFIQGVAIFALASRRYLECIVLGACGLGYTVFLFTANNPALLTGCMAGGALISLALVLFVGVVRYARSHP